ncbi:MAG: hypothetical protein AB8E82_11645 [Aureispira sp.]
MLLFITSGCVITKDINEIITSATKTLEERLNNCSNNQERLHLLLQGDFIAHTNRDSTLRVWRSKTGGDSLLASVQPIGEPSKHGYLLLCGYYLTQLPDEPYFNYVLKVEQISRDTLKIWKYDVRLYTLKEMLDKKVEIDYNLKMHVDTAQSEHYGTYVKKNNTQFVFTVPRSKYLFEGNGPNRHFRERSGLLSLPQEVTKHSYYNKEGKYTYASYNYYIRRHHLNLRELCTAVKKE